LVGLVGQNFFVLASADLSDAASRELSRLSRRNFSISRFAIS